MKKIFRMLFLMGLVLALGTAGASDLEAETHQRMITDKQLYKQIVISLVLMSVGGTGMFVDSNKQSNERTKWYGILHLQKTSNYETIRDIYHTRTKTVHGKPEKRSAS